MRNRAMGSEKGFTMIELIMVIVILGILAAVAVPKFVNMKTEAGKSSADGFFAAANAATSITFSKNMLTTGGTPITTAQLVLDNMDSPPAEWAVKGGSPMVLTATLGGVVYEITVTAETGSARAGLTKTTGW